MVLPSTGPITLLQIKNEMLGSSTPILFSQYYANASSGFTTGVSGIPNTGNVISMSHFRGKSKTTTTTTTASAAYDVRSTTSYSGSGTALNDISGNGYNLTFNTAPTYTTAPNSVTLTTLAQRALGTALVSVPITNSAYSVELLFKFSANSGNFDKLFSYAVSNDRDGLQVQMQPSNQIYLWNAANSNGLYQTSPVTMTTNTWYHVVFSVNSTGGTIYINNVSKACNAYTSTLSTVARYFTLGDQASTRTLRGSYAVARFYNNTLSSTDVASLYNDLKASGYSI